MCLVSSVLFLFYDFIHSFCFSETKIQRIIEQVEEPTKKTIHVIKVLSKKAIKREIFFVKRGKLLYLSVLSDLVR